MTPATVVIAALVLGILIGGSTLIGAPVLAVPIIVLFGVGAFAVLFARRTKEARSVQEFREQAEAGSEFSARDRETQTQQ